MSKFLKVIKELAPTAATLLGGPLAGLAVHAIGKSLGIESPDEGKIEDFLLKHQDPETYLKLRTAELALEKDLARLDYDIKKLEQEGDRLIVDDRISARGMASSTKSRATAIIAGFIIAAFVAIVVALFAVDIPEKSQAVLYVLIGALSGALTQVMNFYFGSSSGSKVKDEQIGHILSGAQGLREMYAERSFVSTGDIEVSELDAAKLNPKNNQTSL